MEKKYDILIKENGTLEQYTEALNNAKECYSLTDEQIRLEIEKYRLQLEEAKELDSKVITIDDLKKRKSNENREKIIKQLLDHASKLKW